MGSEQADAMAAAVMAVAVMVRRVALSGAREGVLCAAAACTPEMDLTTVDLPCATCPMVPDGGAPSLGVSPNTAEVYQTHCAAGSAARTVATGKA